MSPQQPRQPQQPTIPISPTRSLSPPAPPDLLVTAAPALSLPADSTPATVPTTKGSDSSDSDYERYDFSSKPPVALSTFHSETPPPTPAPPHYTGLPR